MTPVRMSLASDRHRVLIEVWDGDPHPPQRVIPDHDAGNGRGLLLVETLSSRWHWYFPEGGEGKIVGRAENRIELLDEPTVLAQHETALAGRLAVRSPVGCSGRR
jgi:hypothetical protein